MISVRGAAVLFVACAALSLSAASFGAGVDPGLLVLRLVDLPTGYQPYKTGRVTHAPAKERAQGLVSADLSEYLAPGNAPLLLLSAASVYNTRANARRFLAPTEQHCKPADKYKCRLVTVGDGGFMTQETYVIQGKSVPQYKITWRCGVVVASVDLLGHGVTPGETMSYAQQQDARITVALTCDGSGTGSPPTSSSKNIGSTNPLAA
jgi:hypothetical protein